ncbi:hypothetical protein ACVWZF_000706 [Thermostichus sp. OS-CIW-30]
MLLSIWILTQCLAQSFLKMAQGCSCQQDSCFKAFSCKGLTDREVRRGLLTRDRRECQVGQGLQTNADQGGFPPDYAEKILGMDN